MKYITDFPSLNGLLTLLAADHRGDSLIENYQTEIFANVIRAGRGQELSRVVTTVMTLRNDSMTKQFLLVKGAKEDFLWKYLRSDDRERNGKPHYLQLFSDPVAAIRDISRVSEDIEALVQDLAQARIVKASEQPESPPSLTELFRIRRAFWYFQLGYEIVHGEESVPSRADAEAQSERSKRLVYYRTHQIGNPCFPKSGWLYRPIGMRTSHIVNCYIYSIPFKLVKELEAVRFHLASLINASQYQGQGKASRSSWQPALLQRLINDLDHWQDDKDDPVDHFLVANLMPYFITSSIMDQEQWGWAMWDGERLRKRGLKPDSRDKRSRLLSDRAFRECEDAQSTYVDRRVAEKFRDDVRPVEEEEERERKKREEQELQSRRLLLREKKFSSKKPLSGKKARRKARVLARDAEKMRKEAADQRKS